MNKSKFYGKILLSCMAASYLQLVGSVGLVFAENNPLPMKSPVVNDAIVTSVEPDVALEMMPIEQEDLEPELILPTMPEIDVVLVQPEVEISVKDGIMEYELMNAEDYEEYDSIIFESSWYLVDKDLGSCPMIEEESILETDVRYTPLATGKYGVNVVASLPEENGEFITSEIGCVSYSVGFPTFDEAQFENLSFRAGEIFSVEYTDEFGFAELTSISGGKLLTVSSNGNVWTIEGPELTADGDYDLALTATSKEGFQSVYNAQYSVDAGVISSVQSTLSVVMKEEDVEYVEAGFGELIITFTAYDNYRNEINIENLDSVRVYLGGKLLGGVDSISPNQYVVERIATVPDEENLNTEVVVDVFSEECDGTLAKEENYCFSKMKTFVVYEAMALPVSDLKYIERTNESSVIISGSKIAGYGVKVNSVDSEYVVLPDDLTTFSFEISLAEGLNAIDIYAVKIISEELVFYSKPTVITVMKDTSISSPVWRETAITLDGNNQATLHWIDPIYLTDTDYDFTHVNIYRSTVPNFVPSEDNLVVQTHNPSWTDTGLTAGIAYYYSIESVDNLGNTAMINTVESSGNILGEAATVAVEQVWYEDLFTGKGVYDGEESSINGGAVTDLIDDEYVEGENEGFAERISELFNKAKVGASSFASRLFNNIFVQIIFGGVVIFLGLMILISVLVWLKERVLSSSLSLDEVDSVIKKGKKAHSSKKHTSKSKKTTKKKKKK